MATIHVSEWDGVDKSVVELQKLEEKAAKAQEAFEKEEKLRKELEVLNAKLLEEKNALLGSLEGEKGSLSEVQERAAKLQAQKADLESQLRVSTNLKVIPWFLRDIKTSLIYKKRVSWTLRQTNFMNSKILITLISLKVIVDSGSKSCRNVSTTVINNVTSTEIATEI